MKKFDFICRELKISDDWLGCTIEFSEGRTDDDEELSPLDSEHDPEKYLMIQRSYPEELYEIDWYTIEQSKDLDAVFSQKDRMLIKTTRTTFEMDWSGEFSSIRLEISDKEYENLIETLKKKFTEKVLFL